MFLCSFPLERPTRATPLDQSVKLYTPITVLRKDNGIPPPILGASTIYQGMKQSTSPGFAPGQTGFLLESLFFMVPFLSLQIPRDHATEKKLAAARITILRVCFIALHCMLCLALLSLAFLPFFSSDRVMKKGHDNWKYS